MTLFVAFVSIFGIVLASFIAHICLYKSNRRAVLGLHAAQSVENRRRTLRELNLVPQIRENILRHVKHENQHTSLIDPLHLKDLSGFTENAQLALCSLSDKGELYAGIQFPEFPPITGFNNTKFIVILAKCLGLWY